MASCHQFLVNSVAFAPATHAVAMRLSVAFALAAHDLLAVWSYDYIAE